MKGRRRPRFLGPWRQPQQGVNADALQIPRFCLLHLTREAGPRASPPVNTAKNMLIRNTTWQQNQLPGPQKDEKETLEKLGC